MKNTLDLYISSSYRLALVVAITGALSFALPARSEGVEQSRTLEWSHGPRQTRVPIEPWPWIPTSLDGENFDRLVSTTDRLLANGYGLLAKLTIEASILAQRVERVGLDEVVTESRQAWTTLDALRRDIVGSPAIETIADWSQPRLVEWVVNELRERDVLAMDGGTNSLLLDTFARTELHPELDQREPSRREAYWVDCDAAVVVVYAVLEEIQKRHPERRFLDGVRAASLSSHVALALETRGRTLIADLNRRPPRRDRPVRLSWLPDRLYRERVSDPRGETLYLLDFWDDMVANTWEIAAGALNRSARHVAARLFALEALRRHPGSVGAWNNLAIALWGLDRHQEALETFEIALQHQRHNPHILTNISTLYLQIGEIRKALAAANSAIHAEPALAPAYLRRRTARARLGMERAAARDLERYTRLVLASYR